MVKTHKPIFSIQDEPPVWPDDTDDLDIESVSEPELEAEQDVDSSVVEDSSDTFFDSPDAPNKKHEELEEEHDNALIGVEQEDANKTPGAKSDDEFEGPGGFVRRDTLRPGAPGGTAPAPVPIEIGTQDDVEDEDWTDPMTPASIPPSLPPKSAPNGRDAIELNAPSQPPSTPPHHSQPMRIPSSGKRHTTSTSSPGGGSLRVKHSPVRNRQLPSNEVPFPSTPTQQGAGGYPFPDSPTTDDSSGAEAGSSERPVMPSIVPKRERKTTVGRSVRAKHGGRTVSGGVKGIWKDDEGDDF
jgi:cysteine protease ATG4